jgi:hypothetical protein
VFDAPEGSVYYGIPGLIGMRDGLVVFAQNYWHRAEARQTAGLPA